MCVRVWRCRKHIKKLRSFLSYSHFSPISFTCCEIFFYPKKYISSKCILSSVSLPLCRFLCVSEIYNTCLPMPLLFGISFAVAIVSNFWFFLFSAVCASVHIMRAYNPLTLLLSDSSLRKFLFVNVTSKMCRGESEFLCKCSVCVRVLCMDILRCKCKHIPWLSFTLGWCCCCCRCCFLYVCASVIPILLGFQWQITSNSSMSKSDCVLLSTQEIVFFHLQPTAAATESIHSHTHKIQALTMKTPN